MSGVLYYTIGIAFASGIFFRSFFYIGTIEILFLTFLSLVLALLWRTGSHASSSPPLIGSVACLLLALGMLRLDFEEQKVSPLESMVGSDLEVIGVIKREPDERSRMVHLYVELDDVGALILVGTEKYQPFAYGDRVLVKGVLTEPEVFETDLGRTFDYPGYLKARGVEQSISFAEVVILDSGMGNPLMQNIFAFKTKFMESLELSVTEPAAGLGEGLLLGVKRALGEDLEDVFRRAGIIHIVVLSGYNVMIVAEAIMRLLSFVFMPRTRLVIGVVGISTFALLVGLTATVVRASIMAVLILIARATGRTYAILRALTFAGVVMLVINPYLLAYDPGFQLSFLATLGLVFLAPLIEERLHLIPTTLQVREFLTATVATQIFVLPLLLYLIGEVSLIAIVVNVLVLPMVPVAMGLTFIAGVMSIVSVEMGTIVGYIAYLSLEYIILIAEFFARLPLATVGVPAFPFLMVIVGYALLLMGITVVRKKETYTDTDSDNLIPTDDYSDWTIETINENAQETETNPFPFR